MAVSHNNLGLILRRQGDPAAAAAAFERALTIEERLVREQPGDLALQSSLGGVLHNLGMLHEQAGELDQAAARFASAIEHQRQASAGAPQVARYRQFLGQHLASYSRVLRQLGRDAEALAVTKESAQFAHFTQAQP